MGCRISTGSVLSTILLNQLTLRLEVQRFAHLRHPLHQSVDEFRKAIPKSSHRVHTPPEQVKNADLDSVSGGSKYPGTLVILYPPRHEGFL